MAWHPKLTVRRGNSGRVTSPTTSAGYALIATLALLFMGLIGALAAVAAPLVLICLVPAISLRDAWAWFASSADERRDFVERVDRLVALPRPFDVTKMIFGLAALWIGGPILWFCLSHRVEFVLPALLVLIVYGSVMIDVVRERNGRS